jgi:hypothetical protein
LKELKGGELEAKLAADIISSGNFEKFELRWRMAASLAGISEGLRRCEKFHVAGFRLRKKKR